MQEKDAISKRGSADQKGYVAHLCSQRPVPDATMSKPLPSSMLQRS